MSHKSSVPPFLIRFYVGVLFLLNYSDLHPCVSLYKHLMPHKEEFHYMSTQWDFRMLLCWDSLKTFCTANQENLLLHNSQVEIWKYSFVREECVRSTLILCLKKIPTLIQTQYMNQQQMFCVQRTCHKIN